MSEHRFATAMQAAITVSDVQQAFLATGSAVVAAGGYAFCRIEPGSGTVHTAVTDACPELVRDYESYGHRDDPVLRLAAARRRPVDSSRVAAWQRSGALAALRVGGFAHSMLVPLLVGGTVYGTLNFARTAAHGPFTRRDLDVARRCGEHVQLAVQRGLAVSAAMRTATVAEHAVDALPHGVVVTGLDGRLLLCNRAARSAGPAFAADSALAIRSDGRKTDTRSVRMPGRHLVLKSHRIPDAVVTVIHDCLADNVPPKPQWNVLSKREREIALLAGEGLTTRQIADRIFVTENTVKQHLKRAFAKTGVHSRIELLRYVR